MKNKVLTQRQQRVEICQDVIDTIKSSESYRILRGVYMRDMGSLHDVNSPEELQKVIKRKSRHCSVCAKGALMISSIDKFNQCSVVKLKLDHDDQGVDKDHNLRRYFSKKLLDVIEILFEQEVFCYSDKEFKRNYNIPTKKGQKLIVQSRKIFGTNNNDVLISIMQNIVVNNGELHFAGEIWTR